MPFDYKKKYKEFYLPPQKPQLLEVPPMNYVAVRGHGDPNAQDGEYQAAIGMLYAVAFTIKMSYKGTHQIPGYFEYVVPPLEGLWWQELDNCIIRKDGEGITGPAYYYDLFTRAQTRFGPAASLDSIG